MIKAALNNNNDSLSIHIKTYDEFQQLARRTPKRTSTFAENKTLFFILSYATEFDRFSFQFSN